MSSWCDASIGQIYFSHNSLIDGDFLLWEFLRCIHLRYCPASWVFRRESVLMDLVHQKGTNQIKAFEKLFEDESSQSAEAAGLNRR